LVESCALDGGALPRGLMSSTSLDAGDQRPCGELERCVAAFGASDLVFNPKTGNYCF
jgi:hypothetical protein